MESIHIMPDWFLGTNIAFELLFFVFAAFISYYAFRIYQFTNQRESKIFGWSFSFLAISHLMLIIINSLFLSIANGGLRVLEFEEIIEMKNLIVEAYILFFILGLITLLYMSLKIKNTRVYLLLIALSAVIFLFTDDISLLIYALASIFLLLITIYYSSEFNRTKNKNTLLVFIGFFLLLISNSLLALVADYSLPRVYVAAYVFELIGYSFIVSSLINVLKNGKKTK